MEVVRRCAAAIMLTELLWCPTYRTKSEAKRSKAIIGALLLSCEGCCAFSLCLAAED